MQTNAQKLEYFQSQFFKSDLIHLNNAGLQPITRAAHDKINYWSKRFWEEGFNTDKDYFADVMSSRQKLAQLIGCQTSEVAFFLSTAAAINQVAFGVGLKPDDEVLMWDQEYASHLYPWKAACDAAGAKLILIDSEKNLATPTEKYIKAITAKTKVIAFSWVQFMSGSQMEDIQSLITLAKSKGIFVFVDIIQGFGFHSCSIWQWGADAVMGGSHKWLCAPVGVGYLAIRESLISKMKPHVVGAYTFGTCDDPSDLTCEPKKDATKYEPASKQVLEITALGASIGVLQSTGLDVIEAEALRLAKKLRLGLTDLGFQVVSPFSGEKIHSSPFVNFKTADDQKIQKISELLNHHQIFHALRGPGIRLTTQAFNTDHEIQKVLSVLGSI